MLFARTYRFQSRKGIEDIKKCLLGSHVKVHNMDFEVFEKENMLKIIPHAEQEEKIKTLPITHVEFGGKGPDTQVIVSSKMRKIDKGGPMIFICFCLFMIGAAIILSLSGGMQFKGYSFPLAGIGLLGFILFWLRLESGYFDYVRKIRDYVKTQCAA